MRSFRDHQSYAEFSRNFVDKTKAEAPKEKPCYVTTTKGSAWFAVMVWWNPEGFWEPLETGLGRYATQEEAAVEGEEWAEDEWLEFK